ncbi:MAG TPA: hypothetical protein VMG10_08890 [Gemmataceae bacterium]|nr:hypothetical protein [Gemmataceae bacterium]
MELLTCPSCGCSVQTADALLGRRVRCFACKHSFLATAERIAPPKPPSGRSRDPARRIGAPREDEEDFDSGERGPFCPGCGRRIAWSDLSCPHCGEELEAEDEGWAARRQAIDRIRRDCEPHRGRLILSLGNVSMIVGGLSLCTFGVGAVVSVPVGILAWLMANHDLERMREGRLDARGKSQTETGRTGAVAGIVLGVIFAAFYALLWLAG